MNRTIRHSIKRIALAGALATLAVGVVAPTVAQAAPAPAHTATSKSSKASDSPQFRWQKGTMVIVQNTGDQSIWVVKLYPFGATSDDPVQIDPGKQYTWQGKRDGQDDVELAVYFNKGDADREKNGIDVDAENPLYSTPWLSVDWDSEYFNEGSSHTWVTKDGSRYHGRRSHDSHEHKVFWLQITNV